MYAGDVGEQRNAGDSDVTTVSGNDSLSHHVCTCRQGNNLRLVSNSALTEVRIVITSFFSRLVSVDETVQFSHCIRIERLSQLLSQNRSVDLIVDSVGNNLLRRFSTATVMQREHHTSRVVFELNVPNHGLFALEGVQVVRIDVSKEFNFNFTADNVAPKLFDCQTIIAVESLRANVRFRHGFVVFAKLTGVGVSHEESASRGLNVFH